MEIEQIRLRTLLKEDTYYRQWFQKEPKIKVVHYTDPWRLYLQKERGGRWARVDIPSYPKALGAVKLRLSEYWDMTIHCKPQAFKPPVVKVSGKKIWAPAPEGHTWCGFCRRFTVFNYYHKHPNSRFIIADQERCSICAVPKRNLTEYRSPELWPLRADQLPS